MANKSLTDLTERTATADSDLLHVNSDGTDYKQAKSDFVSDLAQEVTFSNSSTLTAQADSIASSKGAGLYYGTISSYGHQSETGMPTNDNFLITLEVRSATVMRLTAKRASGISTYENQKSTSWNGWIEMPTRAELDRKLVDVSTYFPINSALSPTGYNSRVFYDPYTHSVSGSFFVLTNTSFGTATNIITISNAAYRPSSTKSIMGMIMANNTIYPYSGNVYSDGSIRQAASGVCTGAWFTFEYDV